MVFKYHTFNPNDPDLLNARPGSPHPFFSLIASASSSPDVWGNCGCVIGFAAGIASAHRRCSSAPCFQTPVTLLGAEAGASDREQAPAPARNPAGNRTNAVQRRVLEVSSLFSKVGEMAVDLLDTVGSFTYTSRSTKKPNEIGILSFEVASVIVRGVNLMESLSRENIRHLMEVVLTSKGVQCLVAEDMGELLKIAAMDKKEKLKVFLSEVARFGNLCKDPQWHNMYRYFEKLLLGELPRKQPKIEAETLIQQLMNMVHYTAELYYELQAMDGLWQEHIRNRHDVDSSIAGQNVGAHDNLPILRPNLKFRLRLVKTLKKKSLWSRILEEVMEKLVDFCFSLVFKLHETFGIVETMWISKESGDVKNQRTLGSACLDLQYANIIAQISALASQPSAVTPNMRDALYQVLPSHVKSAVRRELLALHVPEEPTVSEIKKVMERKLQWLMPMATKTIKARHSFGGLVEWANDVTNPSTEPADVVRIETLYHADIERTDLHILELLSWLHLLVGHSREPDSALRSLAQDVVQLSPPRPDSSSIDETLDKIRMERPVSKRSLRPGEVKAQVIKGRHRLATSSDSAVTEGPLYPYIRSDIDWMKVYLDVVDGVDMA